MIHVAHDGDDRRTGSGVGVVLDRLSDLLRGGWHHVLVHLDFGFAHIEAEVGGNQVGSIVVNLLVDGRHHSVLHQFADNRAGTNVQFVSQFLHRHQRR